MRKRPSSRPAWLVVAFVALAGVLPACGDGGGAESQPTPQPTMFGDGVFDSVPLPPRAESAGERSERDGVVAQSYFVRDRTPRDVLRFYEDYFDDQGVVVVTSPQRIGENAWRGVWLVEGRELLVAAQPAPTADGERVEHAALVTQLSLGLWPEGEGGHVGDITDADG